jgi:hypothetical protein
LLTPEQFVALADEMRTRGVRKFSFTDSGCDVEFGPQIDHTGMQMADLEKKLAVERFNQATEDNSDLLDWST